MAPSTTVWPSCGCHCSASTSNIHPGSRACSSTHTYKQLGWRKLLGSSPYRNEDGRTWEPGRSPHVQLDQHGSIECMSRADGGETCPPVQYSC